MSTTWELFQRWMQAKGYPSAYAGCTALGMTRASATQWKQGRNADTATLMRMAEELGEDPMPIIAKAMSEGAISEANRKAWLRLAKRASIAAAVMLGVLTGLSVPEYAGARSVVNIEQAIHYAHYC